MRSSKVSASPIGPVLRGWAFICFGYGPAFAIGGLVFGGANDIKFLAKDVEAVLAFAGLALIQGAFFGAVWAALVGFPMKVIRRRRSLSRTFVVSASTLAMLVIALAVFGVIYVTGEGRLVGVQAALVSHVAVGVVVGGLGGVGAAHV